MRKCSKNIYIFRKYLHQLIFCNVFSSFFLLLDCIDWYQPIMGEIDVSELITVLFTCKRQLAYNEAFWQNLNTTLEIRGQRT